MRAQIGYLRRQAKSQVALRDGLPVIPCLRLRPSEFKAARCRLSMAEVIPYHGARRPGIRPAVTRIGQRDDPMGAEPQLGKVISMTVVYLVQHGDKQPGPGGPGLTELGRMQATRTGRRLGGLGIGALWARTAEDRDPVPGGGQSARQAGARLKEFLAGLRGLPGPVTHGGITAELLRTLLGDDALLLGALAAGVPPCAITTLDDLNPVMIASVSHLP
jgi:hypothetical protein